MRSPRSSFSFVVEPPESQSLYRWTYLNSTECSHVSPGLTLPPSQSSVIGWWETSLRHVPLSFCFFPFFFFLKFSPSSCPFLCCYLKVSFYNDDSFIPSAPLVSPFLSSLFPLSSSLPSVSKDVSSTQTPCPEALPELWDRSYVRCCGVSSSQRRQLFLTHTKTF